MGVHFFIYNQYIFNDAGEDNQNLMIFLLSILSASLVGLCICFNKKSKKSALKAEKAFQEALSQFQESMDTINIHTEIIHAKAALINGEQINANDRLIGLPTMVKSLSHNINHDIICKLLKELKQIKTPINIFRDNAEELRPGIKTSMRKSADYYDKWVDEAIEICDNLIRLKE